MSLQLQGTKPEVLIVIGAIMINQLMQINGISEDEMMEYIRKYK